MFFAVMKKEFRQRSIYKANSILGLIANVLQLIIQVSLWKFLIRGGAGGISFNDMVLYALLTVVVDSFTYSNISDELGGRVYDGSIVGDLLRPCGLRRLCMAQYYGGVLYRLAYNVLPVLLAAALLLRVRLDFDPLRLLFFLLSVLCASFMMFFLQFLLGLTSFWLQKIWYMGFYLDGCMALFGGSLIPVWFYPAPLAALSRALPFRYLLFEPISLLIQKAGPAACLRTLLIQLTWIAVLWAAGQLLWKRAERRIFINGG